VVVLVVVGPVMVEVEVSVVVDAGNVLVVVTV
jgi:hypothetical protein